ncbi:MAG: 3-deoxy-D-manno-octulosonic acid transferase [Nitrospirae bacterium]|nr:3-deoxy-D-manno-octulosonic acid transferase [Nitrospirota bacterium]
MFLIYSILYTAALLILFMPEYLKRPSDLRKKWLCDKFGFFDLLRITHHSSPIWIHAVSVGEVNAAMPFLRKLKAAYPDIPLILSTITDTGQAVARQKAPEGTHLVYLPFDLRIILKKCFDKIRPRLLIVMETELWPNIFRIAAERTVPVIILNGRISERSSRRYQKASFFMKKVFDHVTLFCMQSPSDADRIKSIGAEESKVIVLGNFKFDMDISQHIPFWAREVQGQVIVAGSTHAGEEQIIIDAYRENVYLFPGLKLIIAPRHPERFGEAEEVIRKSDIRYIKRSQLGPEGEDPGSKKFNILLLDTVGELTAVYGIATIAIMGKSIEGVGGQNPLEPAFWGKPIICGQHMENFPFIKDFYAAGAAFQVTSTGLAKKIKELLMQPEKAKSAGEKARALYLKNSGAVDRAMQIVDGFVKTPFA